MNQTYMHELLFIMNMVEGQHKVTGAHFKNLTRIDLGDDEVFEKMGSVTGVDLAKPGELEAALGPLNAAMIGEINQLKHQLGQLTRERDDAQERERALQQAAEAAEQDRQVLLDTLAERTRQIEVLQAQLAGQTQAASVS